MASGGFLFNASSSAPTLFGTSTSGGTPNLFGTGSQQLGAVGGNLFGTPSAITCQPANITSTSSGFSLGSAGTLFSTTTVPASTAPNLFTSFTPAASSAPKQSFGLVTTTTTSAVPSLTGGFFGQPSATTTAFPGLGASSAPGGLNTISTTPSLSSNIGLGGVDLSQSAPGLSGSGMFSGKSDSKAMKEIPVPNEILATVEAFKKYVKDQKNIREEITRISSKPLFKVQEETTSLKNLLSIVSNDIQRNVAIVEKLKQETAQELKSAEIAQRTKDTPLGLQYENVAPTEYFQHLVVVFENRMQLYKNKIEQMEKYLLSLSQASLLTSQELTLAMKKLHETFIALAAQLQTIHETVKTQKEHYLTYRRVFCGDNVENFEVQPLVSVRKDTSHKTSSIAGPTPFSGMSNAAAVAMASALNRTQQPSANAPPTLGLNNSSVLGSGMYSSASLGLDSFNSSSGFGNPNFSFSSSSHPPAIKPLGAFSTSSGLGFSGYDTSSGSSNVGVLGYNSTPTTPFLQKIQLQRPPVGNKRGKRVAHN